VNGLYFGQPWAPGLHQGATRIGTPVGDVCLQCTEPVVAADRGSITSGVLLKPGAGLQFTLAPVHMECQLRVAVGTLAHLVGGHAPWRGSFRMESRAVLAEVNRVRQCHGIGPL
jgi:hypothetical protein